MLCGHIHRPGRVAWGGTVGSTAPCVAGDLRKGPSLVAANGQPVNGSPVYEVHSVTSEGPIESTLRVVAEG